VGCWNWRTAAIRDKTYSENGENEERFRLEKKKRKRKRELDTRNRIRHTDTINMYVCGVLGGYSRTGTCTVWGWLLEFFGQRCRLRRSVGDERCRPRLFPAQELLEVQRYLPQRFVHHAQPDHVVRGDAETRAEHRQPDVLVRHGPAVHAQVPEQHFRVLVVAVHVRRAAVHDGAAVAEQRPRDAHQRVPEEADGHQPLHERLDDQPVAHAVHGQREHGRQHGRRQYGARLRNARERVLGGVLFTVTENVTERTNGGDGRSKSSARIGRGGTIHGGTRLLN